MRLKNSPRSRHQHVVEPCAIEEADRWNLVRDETAGEGHLLPGLAAWLIQLARADRGKCGDPAPEGGAA